MIKFENVSVMNMDNAIRGIRNSWESHEKSDSYVTEKGKFVIGDNDLRLARNLVKAGASHAKFMRQILVSVDLTLPLYVWKQLDQYRVGVVSNSESTMHMITSKPFTADRFVIEEIRPQFQEYLNYLNELRNEYLATKDKKVWRLIIQSLPDGWLQMRTVTLNYAVLGNIYHDRKNHKLREWHDICSWISQLPYSELIIGE